MSLRLIGVVEGGPCTLEALVAEALVREIRRPGPAPLVACEHAGGLARQLQALGPALTIPDPAAHPAVPGYGEAVWESYEGMLRALGEDRFVTSLPLAGEGRRVDAKPFFLDRLVWCPPLRDFTAFAEALPWDEIEEVTLLGGVSARSTLPERLAHEARKRDLPLRGVPVGPVLGRWAPPWLFGCTQIEVAFPEDRDALLSLGLPALIHVAPDPARHPAHEPLALDSAEAEVLHVDYTGPCARASALPILADFVRAHADHIKELVIPAKAHARPTLEAMLRGRLGAVPLRLSAEPDDALLLALQQPGLAFLSLEPYRLLYAGAVLPGQRVGVLTEEWEASGTGPLPLAERWAIAGAPR